MKADASNDDSREGFAASRAGSSGQPVFNEAPENGSHSVEVSAAEVEKLRARLTQLEHESIEAASTRQQVEQALVLTRRQFANLIEEHTPLRGAVEAATKGLSAVRADLAQTEARLSEAHHNLATMESGLRQKQEENSQAWTEVSQLRSKLEELEKELAAEVRAKLELEKDLAEANDWVFKLAGDRREAQIAIARLERKVENEIRRRESMEREAQASKEIATSLARELADSQSRLDLVEERRNEANDELVAMTRFLRASESFAAEQEKRADWLAGVTNILNSKGPWWIRILPRAWARHWYYHRLSSQQLFDAKGYLARYPDVRASGQDPLQHYLSHGMAEGRQI